MHIPSEQRLLSGFGGAAPWQPELPAVDYIWKPFRGHAYTRITVFPRSCVQPGGCTLAHMHLHTCTCTNASEFLRDVPAGAGADGRRRTGTRLDTCVRTSLSDVSLQMSLHVGIHQGSRGGVGE